MEDIFFGARAVGETVYSVDSARVTCRISEHWKTQHTMTSYCGGSEEYTVTKRCGLTKTDLETLTTSLSSTIGIPKLAELKSAVEEKVGSEIKWEFGLETQHKHAVQAPPCGRRTDIVYQKFRDYDFLLNRKNWLGRTHTRSWSVSEAISNYCVQPEIEVWIPECQCQKKVDPPRFDIMPAVLQIGSVCLGIEIWSSSSGVRLNFAGRLAALDSMPNRPIKLEIPKSILSPIVLWLAGTTDDPAKAMLLPNYELFPQAELSPQAQTEIPQEESFTDLVQLKEESAQAIRKYVQSDIMMG
ncbi:MAG: hypothetical protein CV089_14890 [Nitrospira sp. WS110]|nr:hypothetical protein [Nitrospira sp. WS110]